MKDKKVSPRLLNLSEASTRLNLGNNSTLLSIANSGGFPSEILKWGLIKIGKFYKIHEQAIKFYLIVVRKELQGFVYTEYFNYEQAEKFASNIIPSINLKMIKRAIEDHELFYCDKGIPKYCLEDWLDLFIEEEPK